MAGWALKMDKFQDIRWRGDGALPVSGAEPHKSFKA
jgi:hypothetical protein